MVETRKDTCKKPLYKSLYFQVITAIILGVILGHFWPQTGAAMKPLGDGFIKLIKMIIAPIIFCTVVVGIAGMEDMKRVGKTGGYALLYFEIMSTVALIIGLIGCLEGLKVEGTAQSVGERTTSSVVQAISLVIILDALAALWFMQMGW